MTVRQRDGVLIGTMAGMIATLFKDIPNFILFRLGLVKVTYWQLAASTFVLPRQIDSPLSLAIGAAADLILGGFLGMTILVIFRIFGRDLWWYKGLVVGNSIWFFGSGLALNIFTRIVPLDPVFRLSSLFEHQIYGLSAAFLIWWWTKPKAKR